MIVKIKSDSIKKFKSVIRENIQNPALPLDFGVVLASNYNIRDSSIFNEGIKLEDKLESNDNYFILLRPSYFEFFKKIENLHSSKTIRWKIYNNYFSLQSFKHFIEKNKVQTDQKIYYFSFDKVNKYLRPLSIEPSSLEAINLTYFSKDKINKILNNKYYSYLSSVEQKEVIITSIDKLKELNIPWSKRRIHYSLKINYNNNELEGIIYVYSLASLENSENKVIIKRIEFKGKRRNF
ncbi:MAG: hypothetical protein ABGW69_02085 [Nanoarchaeota archaeon]